jgi:hypothetical protein
VVDYHSIQVVDRRPTAFSFAKMSSKVILARQYSKPIEVFALDYFVETMLVISDGAEVAFAAGQDFLPNIAASRHVPKHDATVEKIGCVSLAQDIAAAQMFHTTGDMRIPEQPLEGGQRLEAKHIEAVHRQSVIYVQTVQDLHPAKIDLAKRMRVVRNGLEQVVGNLRKLALR